MKRNALILVTLCLALGTSCARTKSAPANLSAGGTASITSTDTQTMAEMAAGGSEADLQNATNPGLLNGLGNAFSFQLGGFPFLPNNSCITLQDKSSAGKRDILYTFDCKSDRGTLTGTVEVVEELTPATIASLEVIEQLVATESSGVKRTLSSGLTILRGADGSREIDKQYSETTQNGSNTFAVTGTLHATFTPDQAGKPELGGAVVLKSTLDLVKNGTDQGTFTVTSSGLHLAPCGFDKGSIEFKSPNHDITLTFDGCGIHSILPPPPTPIPARSGISGTVFDVGGPACQPNTCGTRGVSTVVTILTADGSHTTTQSDSNGKFAIALPPGQYQVYAGQLNGGLPASQGTVEVTVKDGGITSGVGLLVDSGIR